MTVLSRTVGSNPLSGFGVAIGQAGGASDGGGAASMLGRIPMWAQGIYDASHKERTHAAGDPADER